MSPPYSFEPLKKRQAGVLLHISSLANDYAIGNFGTGAYRFIDFLEASGLSVWQVCPLGPTGYGDSPYQCFSSFALNPYFIDLEALVSLSYLEEKDLLDYKAKDPKQLDYGQVYSLFWKLAHKAYTAYRLKPKTYPGFKPFEDFCEQSAEWLDPYASFMSLKALQKGKPLKDWPKNLKNYKTHQESLSAQNLEDSSHFYKFLQYLAFAQWAQLRSYAKAKNISLIGDIPIFVAEDSADLWAHADLFLVDDKLAPTALAGVPPDYFSPTGQLWGNPLYDWKALKKTAYHFWIKRLEMAKSLFDLVRLDHFRGFESFWAIPAGSKDAVRGQWQEGPGRDFFDTIAKHFKGNIRLIAENLGLITEPVKELLRATGLPSMAVLQFAFGSPKDDPNWAHNCTPNQVVYTGTHDNDTAWGWYSKASRAVQQELRDYLSVDGSAVPWDLIRSAYQSVCKLAIFPMQDLMSLGSEARLNTPSRAQNNWTWRYTEAQLKALCKESAGYLHYLGSLYGRI